MHPISDKELDKLFQRRFEELEFQPSGDVWMKISAKMDQKASVKRSFPVFWMAAASVAVVLGAGLWFYRPVEVIKLQGTGPQEMVQDIPVSPITDLGTGAAKLDPHQPEIKGFDFSKLAVSEEKAFNTPAEVTLPERTVGEAVRQDVIASNNTPRRSLQEVSPSKDVKVPRYTGDQSKLDVTQPDMIASVEVVHDDLVPEHEQSAPKRIRSVGSLVNFVISKVDRRDDKIIEFKDGDEGSEVSGINLGLIRLKSRNK